MVLIAGDGHHAWLNTTALMHLAMPVRDSVVRENEWFSVYPRLVTLVGNDGTSPDAFRRTLDAAAARGWSGWSTSSSAVAARSGPTAGPRAATCCGSAGRPTPTPSTT